MIDRFFQWGYTKFVLEPYLKGLSRGNIKIRLIYEQDEIDHAMYEKEVIKRVTDKRTDH